MYTFVGKSAKCFCKTVLTICESRLILLFKLQRFKIFRSKVSLPCNQINHDYLLRKLHFSYFYLLIGNSVNILIVQIFPFY